MKKANFLEASTKSKPIFRSLLSVRQTPGGRVGGGVLLGILGGGVPPGSLDKKMKFPPPFFRLDL